METSFPVCQPSSCTGPSNSSCVSVSSGILLSQWYPCRRQLPTVLSQHCRSLSVAVSAVTVKVLPDGHSKGAYSLPRCPHHLPRDVSPVLHPLLLLEIWRLVGSLALLAGWLHVLIAGCVPWLLREGPCFSTRSTSGVLFRFWYWAIYF